MAYTYPITYPTLRGVANITWRAVRADMQTSSPLTYAQQVIKHQGQRWEADVVLPPMERAEAKEFISFCLRLDGRTGTFLFSPPAEELPSGALGGTPLVAGASQTGSELNIDGLTFSVTDWMKGGDFFQIWTGAASRLHMVTQDVSSDGAGLATLDIWPNLRESPTDNLAITTSSPTGVFGMESPTTDWSIDEMTNYGLAFGIVEAL